jgi:hypothetical protein
MDPEQPDPGIHQHDVLMPNSKKTNVALDSVLQCVVTSAPEQVTPPTLHKDTAAANRNVAFPTNDFGTSYLSSCRR